MEGKTDNNFFQNEELEKLLKKYISKRQYKAYTPVLYEIFRRRAYLYKFSLSDMEAQIKRFVKNVRKIEFEPIEYFYGSSVIAEYNPREKTISILRDYYNKKINKEISKDLIYEDCFLTLTHEVYHAISHDKDIIALAEIKRKTFLYGNSYKGVAKNETFNEVASAKTFYNNYYNYFLKKSNTLNLSYTKICFLPLLLSYCTGIDQNELIAEGLQSKEKFFKKICNKYPLSKEKEVNNILKDINASLENIYKVLYEKKELLEDIEKHVKKEDFIKYNFLNIFDKSCDFFEMQNISNDKRNESIQKISAVLVATLKQYKNNKIFNENDCEEIILNLKEKHSFIDENKGNEYIDSIDLDKPEEKSIEWKNEEILKLTENAFEIGKSRVCLKDIIVFFKRQYNSILNKIKYKTNIKNLNSGSKEENNNESGFDEKYKTSFNGKIDETEKIQETKMIKEDNGR